MGDQTREPKPLRSVQPPASQRPAQRKRWRRLIMFLVLLFAILIVAGVCLHRAKAVRQSTDDAYVHGNQIFLTPRITGTVVAINADNTDLVQKGQPVVVLDDSDAKAALQHAEGALGDTMRKVQQFYANVVQLGANVEANKIALKRAEDDYSRRTSVQDGSISVEDITHAQQTLDVARANLQVAEQQLLAAKALVANVDLRNHPLVLQAEANVLDAKLNQLRTTIEAPETGYISSRSVQVGQRVAPGTPLLVIVPLNQIWVDANYREKELKNVRIGQPVSLASDFYGSSVQYNGHVIGLSPNTGAALSLLPPDEGSGNWIKIVQRVPVRILLDQTQLQEFPLRIGLSMTTEIDTSDRSGAKLTSASAKGPVYSTLIYSNEWSQASNLVQSLVATNLQALSSVANHLSSTDNVHTNSSYE